jgi:molybdopterin/thiamine biosynthesis adenylyltransferase
MRSPGVGLSDAWTTTNSTRPLKRGTPLRIALDAKYARISRDIDFEVLSKATFIVVGAGASGQMVESFARVGVKRFVLFDPDIVETKNLAVQNFTRADVNLAKVDALARRLTEVEFEAGHSEIERLLVLRGGDFLELNETEIDTLVANERALGRQIVLLMATDNHYAQARGNRIAIKHSVLTFFVGVNAGGRGGEVVFFDGADHMRPHHRLPCFRCITKPRYDRRERVRAAGVTPSAVAVASGLPWATSHVDATLSHLVIGATHSRLSDNRHGKLYSDLVSVKKNLVQFQFDPTYDADDGHFGHLMPRPAAAGAPQDNWIVTFNTLFKNRPVLSDCPDCSSGFGLQPGQWQSTDYRVNSPKSDFSQTDLLKGKQNISEANKAQVRFSLKYFFILALLLVALIAIVSALWLLEPQSFWNLLGSFSSAPKTPITPLPGSPP